MFMCKVNGPKGASLTLHEIQCVHDSMNSNIKTDELPQHRFL